MALTRSKDPLVWIDCEMTGLDPDVDRILSISCLITDWQLNVIDDDNNNNDGFSATIQTPPAVLSAMSPWCATTHAATGLTAACLDPATSTTAACAAAELLAYIRARVPQPGVALLAGNSIHADRAFLSHPPWAPILHHLHYRLLDVSSLKEAVRRWAPDRLLLRVPVKRAIHRARDDRDDSIVEARYYMRLLRSLSSSDPSPSPPPSADAAVTAGTGTGTERSGMMSSLPSSSS